MNSNPICHPSPAHKMKCFFLDYVHFWWSAWLIDELEPHLPPLSYQKMKCSIFDYVQLLMIGWAGKWTQTPSFTPLLPKNEMLTFWLCSTSDVGQTGQWTRTPTTIPLQPKKWNAHFWITFTSDDWPGWLMDSNSIHHPSPAKKMKSSFLYYVELLMISQAGWWTRTPSATLLQPKKWNPHFWILFNFWWLAGLVEGLKPHLPPLSSQKMKCYFLDYVQLLMIGWACQWTWTPSTTCLQPKKWNAHFCIMFNF